MIPSIRIDVKNSMLLKEKGHLGNSGKEREGEGERRGTERGGGKLKGYVRKGQGKASVTSRGREGLVGCVRKGAVCVVWSVGWSTLGLCARELWSKELGELAVCGSVGTRMRWSGGECGCGSRGKKVGELFS